MFEELTPLHVDLQGDRPAIPLHDIGVHGMRGQQPRQPFDRESPVLFRDGDVVPGMVRRGESVATAADSVDGLLDLLLRLSVVVGEEDMLRQVCELLLPQGIRIPPVRYADADGDFRSVRKLLEPNLQPVRQEVGFEAGEGIDLGFRGKRGRRVRCL